MYLTQALHRSVQQDPEGVATIFRGRTRTFAQTAERVSRLAGALRELGAGAGERVAILAHNSDRYLETMLAASWVGAVYVPLNTRWALQEISYALRECGARVIAVDDAFADRAGPLRAQVPSLAAVIHTGESKAPDGLLGYEQLLASAECIEDARHGGDTPAGIYYTGGTTATPKGVVLSHANLLTSALGCNALGGLLDPGGRYLHAAPMFHLADGVASLIQSTVGGSHVIVPGFEPRAVLEAISEHRVTALLLVPTMIGMLVDHPDVAGYDLASVRHVLYGTSPISDAVLERAMAMFPAAGFAQPYGMTELSPIATLLLPTDHDDPRRRRSAGRAAPHAEIRVVDADDRDVPPGTVGEVICRGGNVMLGYWNQPEATKVATRGGWMHTGDGGYLDEQGYLYIVDRLKDMIVTGGENVYSSEVENVIAKHPAVRACVVIGMPDHDLGERVHAVVVAAPGATLDARELREFCKQYIGGYKAPRSAEFVDQLPLSGAGKVLKRTLRQRYWAGRDTAVS